MTEPENIQWKRKSFKGNKVWAAHNADGTPRVSKGKVLIKYNLDQPYEYRIALSSLCPEDQAVPAASRTKEDKSKASAGKARKKKTSGGSDAHDLQNLPENCIRIYTDGASSGNPGPSGIGVVLIYKDHRKQISEYIGPATNNIAELTAIQRALSSLKRRDLPIRVFTDSEYAVGLLSRKLSRPLSWQRTPQSNKELVTAIRGLVQTFTDIQFIKVKGHAGIKENEVADFLAVSAVKKGGTQIRK